MIKPQVIYFWFLIWFITTTFFALKKDVDKYDVIYRYIISFIVSNIFLFLGIELGWIR